MTIDPNKHMKVRKSLVVGISFLAFFAAALLPTAINAQSNQLMLADILIALRSKKVSLAERNDIISKAVSARGITFGLTPEIEKELRANMLPGVTIVPAMVIAIEKAQEAGIRYNRQ